MVDIRLEATVNGRKVSRAAKPHLRLLDFLRDDLNLTGNKEGCGAGGDGLPGDRGPGLPGAVGATPAGAPRPAAGPSHSP